MPHRITRRTPRSFVLAALAALAAACASTGPAAAPADSSGASDSETEAGAPTPGSASHREADNSPGTPSSGIMAGWVSYKPPTKRGQVTTLTLCGASTDEGKLISQGRARMDGGKVVDDATAQNLSASFTEAGFERFATRRRPTEPPSGALAAVWIDRGAGVETLFLMPGARQNPATRDLPDVYDGLKKLILSVHMSTPGSMVVTGEGWSGDDMLHQKPGSGGK